MPTQKRPQGSLNKLPANNEFYIGEPIFYKWEFLNWKLERKKCHNFLTTLSEWKFFECYYEGHRIRRGYHIFYFFGNNFDNFKNRFFLVKVCSRWDHCTHSISLFLAVGLQMIIFLLRLTPKEVKSGCRYDWNNCFRVWNVKPKIHSRLMFLS